MNVKKCVRALLCLYLTLIIAMDAVKAQTLKVGDTLPPELWSMPLQVVNHPEGNETLTLNEYKDKLIILDFWATWCAPCIKSLAKLDTLQKEFGEQLAVIPITYENADKVLPFLTKRGYQLPSVINDSTLKRYFPHRSIPHYVWIGMGNVVKAITGSEDVTVETIRSSIKEGRYDFKVKQDLMSFDGRNPLYVNANGGVQEMTPFYRSMLTGPVHGLGKVMSALSKDSTRIITILRGLNCDIAHLFTLAYPEAARFPASRVLAEGKVAEKVRYTGKWEGYKAWLENNQMSYELNFPPTAQYKAIKYAAEDFKRYWGLVADFEDREIDCMVITAAEKFATHYSDTNVRGDNFNTTEGHKLINSGSVKTFTAYLNNYQNKYFYINEIGESLGNRKISFPEDIEDTAGFINLMDRQGVKITPERRMVRVLVIKDHYE